MMNIRLLIIEDDDSLREIMNDYFLFRGCAVQSAENAEQAMEILQRTSFDAVFLDINLPDGSGFDLCRKIRRISDVPVLFLTARTAEADKLNGYAAGGDDYITKPFSLPVLYAKTETMIRRRAGISEQKKYGPVTVDPGKKTVMLAGEQLQLAPKEYEILVFLAENAGHVYSREQLLIRFWGYAFEGSDRVVDDHIRKLRKALKEYRDLIHTVHKTGYCFKCSEED
ncbi:MAG: response regulator transcription factor [Solobacterium sp.]|nr:response regulator transcription factor [Solobacterium sp.]